MTDIIWDGTTTITPPPPTDLPKCTGVISPVTGDVIRFDPPMTGEEYSLIFGAWPKGTSCWGHATHADCHD